MKTHRAPSRHFFTTAHLLVMLFGIFTAVVCSFILVGSIEDNNSREHNSINKPGFNAIRESVEVSPLRVAVSILGTAMNDLK